MNRTLQAKIAKNTKTQQKLTQYLYTVPASSVLLHRESGLLLQYDPHSRFVCTLTPDISFFLQLFDAAFDR